MRLIGLLVALLAVGWLVMTQLQSTPSPALSSQGDDSSAVQAPRNATELKTFEAQVNSLADEQNRKTQDAFEQTR